MKQKIATMMAAMVLVLVFCSAAFGAAKKDNSLETLGLEDALKMVTDNKGKVVLINFFASWCPPCREEIPGLKRIRDSYGLDKLILIGASVGEDADTLRKFMDKMQFNYPVMMSGMDLTQAAQVSGIPHLLIFDAKGEVALNQGGYIPEKQLREFLQQHMQK